MDAKRWARSVRYRQLFLLIAGVTGAAALPLWQLASGSFAFIGLMYIGALLVPIAYFMFANAMQKAIAEITGVEANNHRWLAFATIVPLVGSVLEVVLLSLLAKDAARIEGAEDRSGPVLALAMVRLVMVWLLGPVFGAIASGIGVGSSGFLLAYASGPLVGFAILGFITQMIVTPILDEAALKAEVNLGATGSVGPAAVSGRVSPR